MGRVTLLILLVVLGFNGITKKEILTPMEALDLVKETYASNFTKFSSEDKAEEYYYKLDLADYYLTYEETDETTGYYLIRLYEFVIDDLDTGIGHTVTYGCYWVHPYTGEIELYD